jgi:phage/plasmid-associated DNA primase
MKKPAVQGGLSMGETQPIVGTAHSQAVLDLDGVQNWTSVPAEDASQSQETAPEAALDRGDETAKGSVTLSFMQVLSAEHLSKLKASALSGEHIGKLSWSTAPNGRLLIAYLKPDGTPEQCKDGSPFTRERRSAAEIRREPDGPKYLSPKANGCRLYHSHLAIAAGGYPERLGDRFIPLRITEGELKTEAAIAHDPQRVTIGLGGVSSWQDRRAGGDGSQPLPELEAVPVDGREVRLCFDSDLQKPQVAAALQSLADYLADRGAHILIEVLPNGLDGERLGLDDLIYRHSAAVFHEIAAIARSPFKKQRKDGQTVLVWTFMPEPQSTRERNAYLAGMLGRHWRCGELGKDHWQHWTGTHWRDVFGDDAIARELEQFAVLQGWQNRELITLRSLQAAFRRSIEPAANGGAPGLLPFRNGCLVLDDKHFIPHAPEHGNTWALPYDYSAAAICPGIEAFLLDRLRDPASVAVFRAFARALLTGDRLKCFLEITGPGNSGKTVMSNLLQALVGRENAAAGTLQRLEDRSQRFETAKLAGKRLAVFAECQDYSGQLQNLKALTGDDAIPAEVKGGRHFDFTFTGGVVLVGNGPIRASDPSGAVINRRRSLIVPGVVAASQERQLLESDGHGGWRGELAGELAGLVNWALAMPAAAALEALARDVCSLARAEAKLETLLATDLLADWAEQRLLWAPEKSGDQSLRVGSLDGDPLLYLFPSYLRFVEQQGRNSRPLSLKVFKAKLVDLLRDTLRLPMPPGSPAAGDYKVRDLGSVVPCLRWRGFGDDELPGVIRHAVMVEVSGTGAERVGDGKTPIGNEWNGCNGSEPLTHMREKDSPVVSLIGGESRESVSAIPSIPHKGSQRSAPVPEHPRPVPQGLPIDVQNAKTGEWVAGWYQINTRSGSGSLLCTDPAGETRMVEKKRIRRPLPRQAI